MVNKEQSSDVSLAPDEVSGKLNSSSTIINDIKKLWELKQAELKSQCEILLEHQTQHMKLIDQCRRAEDEMAERIYMKEIDEINKEYEDIKNHVKAKILSDLQQKRKQWQWMENDAPDAEELQKNISASHIAPLRPLRKLRKKRGGSLPRLDHDISDEGLASILLASRSANRQNAMPPSAYQSLKNHEIEADVKFLSFSIIET